MRQAPPPVIPAERLSIGPHQEADLPGAFFVRISLGSHGIAQVWCIDKRVARSPFPDAFHEIPSFIRSSTVKPNSQPTGNVTVVANNQHLADVTVSPTSLTFTTSNRNTTQSIAITAFDDTQAEGGEWIDISHRVNGGGSTTRLRRISRSGCGITIATHMLTATRQYARGFVRFAGRSW